MASAGGSELGGEAVPAEPHAASQHSAAQPSSCGVLRRARIPPARTFTTALSTDQKIEPWMTTSARAHARSNSALAWSAS
ncbi:MAG: hypothetical protein PVF69_05360, partial [Gemmatimonadota bacterium]